MATTKRRSTTKKSSSTRRTTRRPTGLQSASKSAQNLLAETGDTIKSRPKTSAAIAAGLFTGIAAGIAGFLAFKRSGKSWDQFSGDIKADVKDRAATAKTRIKDGLDDAKTKARDVVDRYKDGIDEDKSQAMFAEEAMTLKETGKKTKRPVDDTIETELKTGAISY